MRRLLELIKDVRPDVGVLELKRAEELLRALKDHPEENKSVALASLLARNADEWRQLINRLEQFAKQDEQDLPVLPAGLVRLLPKSGPRSALRGALHLVLGWIRHLQGHLQGVWKLAILLLVVGLFGTGLVLGVWKQAQKTQSAAGPSGLGEFIRTPPLAPTEDVVYEARREAGFTKSEGPLGPVYPPIAELPTSVLLSLLSLTFVLATLGFRFLLAKAPDPELARNAELEKEQEAQNQRQALTREHNKLGGQTRIPYKVPAYLPLPDEVVEDAASLLGRIHTVILGHGVDPIETVRKTLRRGGHLTLSPKTQRRPREIVFLVDREDGSSNPPYYGGVLRLLQKWHSLGVDLAGYTFDSDLHGRLSPLGMGAGGATPLRKVSLVRLCEKHSGAALILCTRHLQVVGVSGGGADFVSPIRSAFPLRAWLDPDPLAKEERDPAGQKSAEDLVAAGFLRFPLSKKGVLALCRYFLEMDPKTASVRGAPSQFRWVEDPLVEPDVFSDSGQAVADALRLWGALGLLVPDASWDQLEALRQAIPELSEVLSDPRYLYSLLRLSQAEGGEPSEKVDGTLVVGQGCRSVWRAALRSKDAGLALEDRLETRARRLLKEQLGKDPPADPLLRQMWEGKNRWHELFLSPERAEEILGNEYDPDLAELLKEEVALQKERPVWSPGCLEQLEERFALVASVAPKGRRGIPLRQVFFGGVRRWMLAAGLGVGIAAAGYFGKEGLHLVGVGTLGGVKEVVLVPKDGEVKKTRRQRWEASAGRPALVSIEAGSFVMGEGMDGEDSLGGGKITAHKVTLTRAFALFVTEVTQGQYAAVTGQRPWVDRDCFYWDKKEGNVSVGRGKGPKGDTLPAYCINFEDAVLYANKLSEQEKLGVCYEGTGDQIRWIPTCDGYRLPTEAEWEYAARANQGTTYAGSNDPKEVAWYVDNSDEGYGKDKGNVHPVGTKRPNQWGLYDMSGNVWEWVFDEWQDSLGQESTTDPVIKNTKNSGRVVRGGSWSDGGRGLTVSYRNGSERSYRSDNRGFRLSRSLP